MKRVAILLVSLCSYFGMQAQTLPATPPKPFIEVNGYAEKEVVPDEIYINITLLERYDGRNKITIEQQEEALKQSIKGLGIPLTNLSLSNADANYVRVNWRNKDVIARKDYLLKVSDAESIGRVFKELDRLDIKNAGLNRYDYSKKEELKKELRIQAIKAAKDKAEYMTAAIGQSISKPLYINERDGGEPPIMYMARTKVMTADAQAPADSSEDYLEFKKMKFSITVNASFEIK